MWRQGVSAEHPLNPTLNPALKRHAYSIRLLHFRVHSRIRGAPFALFAFFAVKKSPSIRVYSCIRGSDSPRLRASVRKKRQPKATKLPTKFATKLMQALKGRDIPAQGNAPGNEAKIG